LGSPVRSFTYCRCVILRKTKDCQEKQLLRLRGLIGTTLQKQIRPDANFPSALGFMIARLHTELSVRNSPGFAGRSSQKMKFFSPRRSARCKSRSISKSGEHKNVKRLLLRYNTSPRCRSFAVRNVTRRTGKSEYYHENSSSNCFASAPRALSPYDLHFGAQRCPSL